jgi:hypothetical protein
MKRFRILLCSMCFLFSFMYGEVATDWIQYRENVLQTVQNIPGWCCTEKATRMMDLAYGLKPEVYVEVGVFGGSSFFPVAKTLQYNGNGVSYAIDPWDNPPCLIGGDPKNNMWWSKIDLRKVMHDFMDLMHTNALDPYYCLMRMTSEQSVHLFKEESVDILHIDGNHSEPSAYFDAYELGLGKIEMLLSSMPNFLVSLGFPPSRVGSYNFGT